MKITRTELWNSIYLISPWVEKVSDIHLPEALYKSCVDIVLQQDSTNFKIDYNKSIAVHNIKEAIIELHEKSFLEFGQ